MRSTVTRVRDLMPLRRISAVEALRVAEVQAARLLRLSAVTEPPVSEEIISNLPHIQVERGVLGPAQAATRWLRGRWVIVVNQDEPEGRQRISLAHELKHVLDHPFITISYRHRDESSDLIEQTCDYFAVCLLIPRRWLRQLWMSGERDFHELAGRFGVTTKAIRVRLLQVGLIEPTSHYLTKEV